MKIGLSPESYVFTRGLVAKPDQSERRYEFLDLPLRYYRPRQAKFMEWLIQRCRYYRKEYGLQGVGVILESLEQSHIIRLRELIAAAGIRSTHVVLEPDFNETGGNYFLASPAEFKKSMKKMVAHFEAAKKLGVTLVSTGNPPYIVNRFTKSIPLQKQLHLYAENARQMAHLAASSGLTVALKNNCDYRVSELIKIIKNAKCDNLMLNFNTANAMMVVEDPIQAAKEAAPYAAMASLRDYFFQAVVWYGARVFGMPLGQGHIEFDKIIKLLEQNSPDSKNLFLNVDIATKEGDEDRAVEESLRWMKEKFHSILQLRKHEQ